MKQSIPTSIAIINRGFWPFYPVIGEALLRFAEDISREGHTVSVIIRDNANISATLKNHSRGKGVFFYPSKAWTTSSSGIISRIIDSLFFSCWTLFCLIRIRPKKIYVSTDPPVFVPFITMLYSCLTRTGFVYHLQDIHPEAANTILPINRFLYNLIIKIDALTMRKALRIITLTNNMAKVIVQRSKTTAPIHILNNPAVSFEGVDHTKLKDPGFSFCGNIGRMQRVPLLLSAIQDYYDKGGKLKFVFVGAGIFSEEVAKFSEKYELFEYRGIVNPEEAAQINTYFSWALLPIEDAVTDYAFPSKASSYVVAGAKILAICGKKTSVAKWVKRYEVGTAVIPQKKQLTDVFFDIENGLLNCNSDNLLRARLSQTLSLEHFVSCLKKIMLQ